MSARASSHAVDKEIARGLSQLNVSAPPSVEEGVLKTLALGDRYVTLESPAGNLYIAFNKQGISLVIGEALVEDSLHFEEIFEKRFGRTVTPSNTHPKGVEEALRTGKAHKLKYDLRSLTEFERAVLRKALEIPVGEVRSYSWIAREIGRPRAVRAVGTALGGNPVPILIPCHRVVRSDGNIGNYGWGPDMKVRLLEGEGVDTNELRELEHAGVRFIGSDTTNIFCHPTCRNARRITPAHRITFKSAAGAADAGYRPCRHCRPAA
jgi:methylated-DNA-[protein]-cysteine S-methyltransferase